MPIATTTLTVPIIPGDARFEKIFATIARELPILRDYFPIDTSDGHERQFAIEVAEGSDGGQWILKIDLTQTDASEPFIHEGIDWSGVGVASDEIGLMERISAEILFIANIAFPGSISLGSGTLCHSSNYTLPESKSRTTRAIDPNLAECVDRSLETKWPKFRRLSVKDVADWLNWNGEWLPHCEADTKVGRALNALSYSFLPGVDRSGKLLRAIMPIVGIEALFSNGKDEPVVKGLKENIQLLLGEQTAFKRAIDEMYSFRSNFMHGSLPIPSAMDYESDILDFALNLDIDADFRNSYSLMVRILLASIQTMIAKGWHEVNFNRAVTIEGK